MMDRCALSLGPRSALPNLPDATGFGISESARRTSLRVSIAMEPWLPRCQSRTGRRNTSIQSGEAVTSDSQNTDAWNPCVDACRTHDVGISVGGVIQHMRVLHGEIIVETLRAYLPRHRRLAHRPLSDSATTRMQVVSANASCNIYGSPTASSIACRCCSFAFAYSSVVNMSRRASVIAYMKPLRLLSSPPS